MTRKGKDRKGKDRTGKGQKNDRTRKGEKKDKKVTVDKFTIKLKAFSRRLYSERLTEVLLKPPSMNTVHYSINTGSLGQGLSIPLVQNSLEKYSKKSTGSLQVGLWMLFEDS